MPLFSDVPTIAGGLTSASGRVTDLAAAKTEAPPSPKLGILFHRFAAKEQQERADDEESIREQRWHEGEIQIPVHHDEEEEEPELPPTPVIARRVLPAPPVNDDDEWEQPASWLRRD